MPWSFTPALELPPSCQHWTSHCCRITPSQSLLLPFPIRATGPRVDVLESLWSWKAVRFALQLTISAITFRWFRFWFRWWGPLCQVLHDINVSVASAAICACAAWSSTSRYGGCSLSYSLRHESLRRTFARKQLKI